MSRITQIIDTLEAERADAKKRLEWIEQQIEEFRKHDTSNGSARPATAKATAKSSRRSGSDASRTTRAGRKTANATTKRPAASAASAKSSAATSSGAGARKPRSDVSAQILEYVAAHPESTAGDVAKQLGLKPNSTSTRMSQMAKDGQLRKAQRGYAVE